MHLIMSSLLRGGMPFLIMAGISFILKLQGKETDAKGTFIVACILFFVGAATTIYQLDSWGLAQKTAVHFLVMLVTVYPLLLISDWFSVITIMDALKVFFYFVVVGIILWSVIMVVRKIVGLDF